MKGIRSIGYISAVYDLFGVRHLEQLRVARAECDLLFVGVLADDVATNITGKRPLIPFEERLSIARAMRAVDIAIGQMTDDLLEVREQLLFDRLFLLTHAVDPVHEKLRTLGVDIVVLSAGLTGTDELPSRIPYTA